MVHSRSPDALLFAPLGDVLARLGGRPVFMAALTPRSWNANVFQTFGEGDSRVGDAMRSQIQEQWARFSRSSIPAPAHQTGSHERLRRQVTQHQKIIDIIKQMLARWPAPALVQGARHLLSSTRMPLGWAPRTKSNEQAFPHWYPERYPHAPSEPRERSSLIYFQDALDFAAFGFQYTTLAERSSGQHYRKHGHVLEVVNLSARSNLVNADNVVIYVAEYILALGKHLSSSALDRTAGLSLYILPVRGLGQWRAALYWPLLKLQSISDFISSRDREGAPMPDDLAKVWPAIESALSQSILEMFSRRLIGAVEDRGVTDSRAIVAAFAQLWWSHAIHVFHGERCVHSALRNSDGRLVDAAPLDVLPRCRGDQKGPLEVIRVSQYEHVMSFHLGKISPEFGQGDRIELEVSLLDAEEFTQDRGHINYLVEQLKVRLSTDLVRATTHLLTSKRAEQYRMVLHVFGHAFGTRLQNAGIVGLRQLASQYDAVPSERVLAFIQRLWPLWGFSEFSTIATCAPAALRRDWLDERFHEYLRGARLPQSLPIALREIEVQARRVVASILTACAGVLRDDQRDQVSVLLDEQELEPVTSDEDELVPFATDRGSRGTKLVTLGLYELMSNAVSYLEKNLVLFRSIMRERATLEVRVRVESPSVLVVTVEHDMLRGSASDLRAGGFRGPVSASIEQIRNLELECLAAPGMPRVVETSQFEFVPHNDNRVRATWRFDWQGIEWHANPPPRIRLNTEPRMED